MRPSKGSPAPAHPSHRFSFASCRVTWHTKVSMVDTRVACLVLLCWRLQEVGLGEQAWLGGQARLGLPAAGGACRACLPRGAPLLAPRACCGKGGCRQHGWGSQAQAAPGQGALLRWVKAAPGSSAVAALCPELSPSRCRGQVSGLHPAQEYNLGVAAHGRGAPSELPGPISGAAAPEQNFLHRGELLQAVHQTDPAQPGSGGGSRSVSLSQHWVSSTLLGTRGLQAGHSSGVLLPLPLPPRSPGYPSLPPESSCQGPSCLLRCSSRRASRPPSPVASLLSGERPGNKWSRRPWPGSRAGRRPAFLCWSFACC